MKISIITVVYNNEQTIRDAIESIQSQTHNSIEHIIIDAKSTDGTIMNKVKLNQYNNNEYRPGSTSKKLLWYFTNMLFYKTLLPFPSGMKTALLRIFGANIGQGVVIKPDVNIKYHGSWRSVMTAGLVKVSG